MSAKSGESKSSIQDTLIKLKMGKHIAIKPGQLQSGNDIADLYDFKEKLGEGSFGKVYRAVHKESGKERAIKLIYK
jgi:serine/threonine protein kinase